ncbi:MAG: PLxRFG domain-containing protein, partial [Pannonibacter phragmitetus]
MTAAETRAALRAGPLAPVVERLEKAGIVRIINEAPGDVPSTAQGWTDPDGSITLVAGNLTPEQVLPVMLHEAFHSGVKPLVGSRAWDGLLSRLSALHRQQVAGQSAFYDAARRQLERTGVSDALTAEEFGAYAVEAYEAAPQTLRRWVNDLAGVIKAWLLRRFGKQAGQVTPAQLRALAAAALRDMSVRVDTPMSDSQPAARGRMFSVAGTPGSATTENRIIETIRGAGTDVTPKLLGLVPLNYFSELKRDNMTAVDRYLSTKRAMDAYRGRKHAAADTLAQKWLKYTRSAGGWLKSKESTTRAEALSALMHEATLAGIDPSRTDPEMSDQPGYAALRKRFLDMPQAGRDLFTEVRDFYAQQADELDRLLLENIRKAQAMAEAHAREQHEQDIERIRKSGKTDPELRDAIESANAKYEATRIKSVWANKARLTRMRKSFESNRVPAPYFPLARWGGYFVSVKNAAGDVISFSRRERKVEADRLARDMRAAYPGADVETGVMSKGNGPRDYMDPTMIAEIEQMLGTTSVDEAVKDALWQRYLQTLPDMSVRKRFIHRKGTAGFGADALRGFANAAFHGAHQLARVKYSLDLTNDLTTVTKQARQADDPVRGMFLANEMADRHKFIMNPTGAKWTQIVNSASFIWMLGLTPAAALINTTQTAMMGIPILGASLGGMTKATAAIARASKDFAAGKGSVAKSSLTADERAAMEQAYQSGLIDRTQAHDLAGLSEGGLRYHPLWTKAMAGISWLYHNAEVFNREVTYLAGYRMARDKGQSHEQAVSTSHDLTWKTHFDYSAASRPRYLQNDAARALLVFQSHTLNMSYRVFRDFHQMFKGESAETRAIARKQLAGIMGMFALFGGVTGMFGFSYMLALAGLVFGDEDDPLDFETQFRADVQELLGPELGGLVLNGVPGHLTGVDLTSRVGMPYLFIRPQDREREGRDWFNSFVLGL